ncbi:MAG: hypothetical protein JWR22_3134 [Herminiimonas sp.]|nr:hypothetical protein [Herminiimonas sp.]
MPFTTPLKFKSILTALSILRYILKSHGQTGTTDAYKNAENFFATILNLTYGFQLHNLNAMKHNYPAIDLGDDSNRVCFQVTGENSSRKIHDTIKKFFAHGLEAHYDQLKFLILTTKRSYTTTFTVPASFDFDTKRDVIDVDDILKVIESKPKEVIDSLHQFIESELSSVLQHFSPPRGLLANAEPRLNLPAKNAGRLAQYMHVESDEFPALRKALDTVYPRLISLSKELREYLFLVLIRGTARNRFGKEVIGIAPVIIEGIMGIDIDRHTQLYSAVSELGLADVPEGEHPPVLYLVWNTSFCVDLFFTFREMLGVDSIELEWLVVHADFTLLDN